MTPFFQTCAGIFLLVCSVVIVFLTVVIVGEMRESRTRFQEKREEFEEMKKRVEGRLNKP